jgi:large subunit ribosomal protein L18
VFRSNANIYAQVIDDGRGHTIASASSREVKNEEKKVERAREVGKLIAERAQANGIKSVVFDRGGYLYHGRIKAMAEGARSGGLEF